MAGSLWIALALLALIGGWLARGRRSAAAVEDEPWRRSLETDDEPLDIEEIRRAEEEWEEDGGWEDSSEDDWR